jgi:hypothetical protein
MIAQDSGLVILTMVNCRLTSSVIRDERDAEPDCKSYYQATSSVSEPGLVVAMCCGNLEIFEIPEDNVRSPGC